jgi:hypothetical protein
MRNNKGIDRDLFFAAVKRVLEGMVMKGLRPKNRMKDEETLCLK